ncbi:CTD nuclear envelope phosphatase 1 isoform X5 [Kogia breviceps]|uniref:CTD nuclear envelope phosphatase 1 isoform X5 n=1 Tax=Kogia breviceps TaxID=27615 RepID=UPI0034D18900
MPSMCNPRQDTRAVAALIAALREKKGTCLGIRGRGPFGLQVESLVLVIQYQTVRYDILPLSPVSRNRLSQVKRKILVLDLDETLIHSHHDGVLRPTVRPGTPPDFILKVVIDKHPVRFFVHKRPHVDFFLEVVSQWYELVVFTASMEIYGSAVADKLDNSRSILKRRYYRQTMPSPSNPGSVTPAIPPFSTCFRCWMPSGSPLMFVLC